MNVGVTVCGWTEWESSWWAGLNASEILKFFKQLD